MVRQSRPSSSVTTQVAAASLLSADVRAPHPASPSPANVAAPTKLLLVILIPAPLHPRWVTVIACSFL